MAKRGEKLEKSFDRLSEKQIEIYANELQAHYHEERRLRRELETRNHELEQRVNELLSLNKLFQKFISEGFNSSNTGLEDLSQGQDRISNSENSDDSTRPTQDDRTISGDVAPQNRS